MEEGYLFCLIGLIIAWCGFRFERLPRGAVWFTLFRPKDEPLPVVLVRQSKICMIAVGLGALVSAAIGVWLHCYWLALPIPAIILTAGILVMYALWLKGTPRSQQIFVWAALGVSLVIIGYWILQSIAEQ